MLKQKYFFLITIAILCWNVALTQSYAPIKDTTQCLKHDFISVYATPDDVRLLRKYSQKCKEVKYLRIVGYKEGKHWEELFDIITKLKGLKGIELYYNEGLKEVPNKIKQNTNLRVIKIVGNRKLDYNDLCNKIKDLPNLESLSLVDNRLKKVPESISKLKNIRSLKISGNEGLNYTQLVDKIKGNKNITELSIPVNSLSELPKNISELKQLKVLDVRKNYIASFPKSISKLDSLNTLKAEGNIIVDFKEESEKLKSLNIKYLSIDVPSDKTDIEAVKKIFKEAKIVTTGLNEEKPEITEDQKAVNKVFYGKGFSEQNYQECWNAIKKYNYLFNRRRLFLEYDSTTFFDRLTDEKYSYNERVIAENQYNGVRLTFHNKRILFAKNLYCPYYKVKKGELAFSICTNGNYYPEMNAFNGMLWVFIGAETKKEFHKKYVKEKVWKDVFVEYDMASKTFYMVLKGSSLVRLPCYPRFTNMNAKIDDAKRQYDSKFKLYQRRLNLRAKRYDTKLKYENRRFKEKAKKWEEIRWKKLRSYMCDYEKGLSKEAWMNYKDFMLKKFHEPLDTLEFNLDNLGKSLTKKFYSKDELQCEPVAQNKILTNSIRINVEFVDSLGNEQDISKLVIIDPVRKNSNFYDYSKARTIEYVPEEGVYAVLIHRSGDFQIMPFNKFHLSPKRGYKKKKPVEIVISPSYMAGSLEEFWKQIN